MITEYLIKRTIKRTFDDYSLFCHSSVAGTGFRAVIAFFGDFAQIDYFFWMDYNKIYSKRRRLDVRGVKMKEKTAKEKKIQRYMLKPTW